MKTKTQKETLDFLKARSRGETENKDNIFLINAKGHIIGHGYATEGSWFNWGSLRGTEICVQLGTKIKDILGDVRLAKKACKAGTYYIEYER